jgi:hypothetical protein
MPIVGNHFSGCTASFHSIAASSSAWIEFNVDSWRRTAREFYLCRWPVVRSHPVITQKTPHSDSEHSLSATLFSSCKIRLTFNWIISTWFDDLLFGIIQQLPVQHMMWIGFRHLRPSAHCCAIARSCLPTRCGVTMASAGSRLVLPDAGVALMTRIFTVLYLYIIWQNIQFHNVVWTLWSGFQ